ncbi:MAG: hypothetical protein PHC54_05465 [Candidatus Omnitrophica bacterium]|nr:hypothetical protein [Candidatus Omnitrophota bacterium]MDD5592651.1 hypothetical protein [Candidatus Omnitrophota bacterium]
MDFTFTKINMPTPRQQIDPGRYLDKEGLRIDTRRLDRAMEQAPGILKVEIMDALDHIRKGFFKALYISTGLKDRRFIATKKVGIGRQIRVYRNPGKGDVLDMELGIFTRSKIAALQETGGTVSAKSGMMAIPIGKALTPTGRLKPEYSVFENYRRSYIPSKVKIPGLFMMAKNGRMFLMQKEGDKIEPLFILKNQIKIQPRLRMLDTWDRMEGYRMETFNKHIDKALNKI